MNRRVGEFEVLETRGEHTRYCDGRRGNQWRGENHLRLNERGYWLGKDRLPFLDTASAAILAEATAGIGLVLEHQYYGAWFTPHPVYCGELNAGEPIPVLNFPTDSQQWFNNA